MNAQDAAEVFWTIATHNDSRVSRYDSPVYVAAEKALIRAIREEYPVTLTFARKVHQLIIEYGPDDMLTGTEPRRGVASYVQYVHINKGRIP